MPKFIYRLAILLILVSQCGFARAQAQDGGERSRLIVSFYSICCGTDRRAQEKLDQFLSRYEKQKRRQLTKSSVHWGREGEIDYCFRLSELSPAEQRRFIAKVRGLLKKSKLVHTYENAPCKSERSGN